MNRMFTEAVISLSEEKRVKTEKSEYKSPLNRKLTKIKNINDVIN